MNYRIHILVFLLSVPLVLSSPIFAQNKEKESSDQKSEWELQKSYEELKKITQKEHDPELNMEELKIFRKPGVYKGKLKTVITELGQSGKQEKKYKKEFTQRLKYVDGNYIVVRNTFENLTGWVVGTYNKKCKCFRSWTLREGQISSVGIGNQVNENVVSWSVSFIASDHKHVINSYEKISPDRRTMRRRGTAVFFGKRIVRTNSKSTFQKPLSEEEKSKDKGTKSY